MVAAQPCGGNEAINQAIKQSIKKERTASARCFSLSVCRFFQRREVAVVEWWLHDSLLLPPV